MERQVARKKLTTVPIQRLLINNIYLYLARVPANIVCVFMCLYVANLLAAMLDCLDGYDPIEGKLYISLWSTSREPPAHQHVVDQTTS